MQTPQKEDGGSIGIFLNDIKERIYVHFFSCHYVHLNGEYYTDPEVQGSFIGIVWKAWLGYEYSLKASTMMIMKV